MMASNNPSAFPVPNDANVNGDPGMTLRDWFAGQAMQGICAHVDSWGLSVPGIADQAYEIADAMLAERAKATGAA